MIAPRSNRRAATPDRAGLSLDDRLKRVSIFHRTEQLLGGKKSEVVHTPDRGASSCANNGTPSKTGICASEAGHNRRAGLSDSPTNTFSLNSAPPLDVPVLELLRSTLHGLPADICCRSPLFEPDALSREACSLCMNAFWYIFCAIQQRDSEAEQNGLLRMMAQVCCQLMTPGCGAM